MSERRRTANDYHRVRMSDARILTEVARSRQDNVVRVRCVCNRKLLHQSLGSGVVVQAALLLGAAARLHRFLDDLRIGEEGVVRHNQTAAVRDDAVSRAPALTQSSAVANANAAGRSSRRHPAPARALDRGGDVAARSKVESAV